MKKKHLKILTLSLATLLLLLAAGNFGLNFWLKNNLPSYIKSNSTYLISYKKLDVDLGTGNINATGVTVNNQNPDSRKDLGIQGTVDSLSISRLGIYDLLFNKSISTADLQLVRPHLNIILPRPEKEKRSGKSNPVKFKNILIKDGQIRVFRSNSEKFVAVKDLDLTLTDFRLTEGSGKQQLPFTFKKYQLSGSDLYFQPDQVYAFTAGSVATVNGKIRIQEFALKPLMSFQNFLLAFPKKRNLFDVKAKEITFTDLQLKNDRLSLQDATLTRPDIVMFTTDSKSKEKKRSFTYEVELGNVLFDQGTIDIRKKSGNRLFKAGNLTMKISELLLNDETAKGNIPFNYKDFNIAGKEIFYASPNEQVMLGTVSIDPKSAMLKRIVVKPLSTGGDRTKLDLSAASLQLKVNRWEFIKNDLDVDVEHIVIDQLNGTIKSGNRPKNNNTGFAGIHFPLKIKRINLKNSNIILDQKNQPLSFKDLNANIWNIEMNAETVKDKIPFKTGNYSLTTRNFAYQTEFYRLSASFVKINKDHLHVSKFVMKPTVTRAQFIRAIPVEKDLYDIEARKVEAKGKWDLVSDRQFLDIQMLTLDQVNANIFRSKIPKDDLTEKPMYSALLRSIKFPLVVHELSIRNSLLVYEEDTKKSDGPGKLTFNNFSLNAKNLNSGKGSGKPTRIPISITCNFMNASPMKVSWVLDTASQKDAFSIAGNISDLPASRINPFIEPYLKIQATGLISDLIFDFTGTKKGIGGTLKMVHQNLKIGILKETGEKNKLLSAVANIFVKTDSGNYPASVEVADVERDPTKSFFNLFWRGIEQGLKKTLLGNSAPKTEQAVKNTVENTKSALEQNKVELKETKAEAQEKIDNVKQKVKEKKEAVKEKGFFKNIFKKKSED